MREPDTRMSSVVIDGSAVVLRCDAADRVADSERRGDMLVALADDTSGAGAADAGAGDASRSRSPCRWRRRPRGDTGDAAVSLLATNVGRGDAAAAAAAARVSDALLGVLGTDESGSDGAPSTSHGRRGDKSRLFGDAVAAAAVVVGASLALAARSPRRRWRRER